MDSHINTIHHHAFNHATLLFFVLRQISVEGAMWPSSITRVFAKCSVSPRKEPISAGFSDTLGATVLNAPAVFANVSSPAVRANTAAPAVFAIADNPAVRGTIMRWTETLLFARASCRQVNS